MGFAELAGLTVVFVSIAMIGWRLVRRPEGFRTSLCAWLATLNFGCAILAVLLLPAHPVTSATAALFSVTGLAFIGLEWKLGRSA